MRDFYPGDEDAEADLGESLHAWVFRGRRLLKRLWWLLLAGASLGLAFEAYREVERVPVYHSTAQLIVEGFVPTTEERERFVADNRNFYGTQLQLMTSDRVKRDARERVVGLHPEFTPVPVDLSARQLPQTSIFVLTASGTDGRYVQAFLGAAMEAFMNYRKTARSSAADEAIVRIGEEVVQLEMDIEELENQVVEFQREHIIGAMEREETSTGSDLASLKGQLEGLKTKAFLLDKLSLEEHFESTTLGDTPGTFEIVTQEAALAYLVAKQEFARLEADRDEFARYLKEKHPKMIAFRQDIERQRSRLEIERRVGLEKLGQLHKVVATRIESLESLISEKEELAREYGVRLAEFGRLQSRLERKKSRLEEKVERRRNIEIAIPLQTDTIAVLQEPTHPVTLAQDLALKMVLSALAGLAVGAGLIVIAGLVDNRVISAEEIKGRFDAPVLGLIPVEAKSSAGKLDFLAPDDRRHVFAEACRTLRSSILFKELQGERPVAMIVTSAVPEEGKSTIAGNLAISLALASARTLLVDADLRRGRFHNAFPGLERSPGLSELVRDGLDPASVIQSTPVENLDVVTCGAVPDRPGELILDPAFARFIAAMRERYDHVIIDSAPILATDDTTSFASKADAVIFAVRSDFSQLRQVRSAVDRLELRGTKVFGFVLNYVDLKGADYYYYYKYNKYYAGGDAAGR